MDISDPSSLAVSMVQLHEILFHDATKNKSILLILNKKDLADARSRAIYRNVLRLDEIKDRDDVKISILSGSSLDPSFIHRVLNWIVIHNS